MAAPPSLAGGGAVYSDSKVAAAISSYILCDQAQVLSLMRRMRKPILKVPIPGKQGRIPTPAMLAAAKRAVLSFYAQEEERGEHSSVVEAFLVATGEPVLSFDWKVARRRVMQAHLDRTNRIDNWEDMLAMQYGDTNKVSRIYVCGTRKISLGALKSLLCHEGMHNFVQRARKGNSFLSEEKEHVAMALMGDPQLHS